MTTDIAARRPATTGPKRAVTVAAAIGYTLTWLVGLLIFSVSTEVGAAGADVLAGYRGHTGPATAQFVLTEGLASVCLALVAWAVGRGVAVAGLVAAGVALVQCGLGVYLTTSVVPAGDVGRAGSVLDAINRLDGVKMLVLAGMAVAGYFFGRRTGRLPGWLSYLAIALAAALLLSGLGYLLFVDSLTLAAWVSLPLLLVWVTGAGLRLRQPGPSA